MLGLTPALRNFFVVPCLMAICAFAAAQKDSASQPKGIEWQKGPTVADLGGVAKINVPAGVKFADGNGARRLLELTGNPPSGDEVGVMVPDRKPGDEAGWTMYFEFDEVGYVSDEDKGKIDANALLDSMKKGTEEANQTRKEKGWIPFHVTGWAKQPFYDEQSHNLTWAILGEDESGKPDNKSVNYSVRVLGRRGTMNVDLVVDPSELQTVLPTFNQLMNGFSYNQGGRYAEFVKGDKVAGYGLAALIGGGAAAVAVKTGFFAAILKVLSGVFLALWKVILVVLAGIASKFKALWSWVKRLFRPSVKKAEDLEVER
jgi:uncharacterized membrane-anchored protein